jgi:hypothetical protein
MAAWTVHFIYPVYYSVAVTHIKIKQNKAITSNKEQKKYTKILIEESQFTNAYRSDEKELIIDGKMYELISFAKKGSAVECVVLYDNEETTLNDAYASGLEKEKTNSSSKPIVYWHPVVCEKIISFQFCYFMQKSSIQFNKQQEPNILTGYLCDVIKPPEGA